MSEQKKELRQDAPKFAATKTTAVVLDRLEQQRCNKELLLRDW